MAKAIHTCTGCVPIDASIIEAYVALITMNKNVSDAEDARVEEEDARVLAENARVEAEGARAIAETERERVSGEDHETAVSDHGIAVLDNETATADHNTAALDHETAVEDHNSSTEATNRANEAAAAAEHMVDIKRGPKGDQGNTGSSVDYPYELANNVTTDDPTKGLSAAQGVVLDGKISQLGQKATALDDYVQNGEDVEFIDVSNYQVCSGSLGGGGRWYVSGRTSHIIIPVTPGERYLLKSDSVSGLFGFLTSSHTEPVENNDVILYATGQSRQDASTFRDIVVPADASYLCLVMVDGGQNDTKWGLVAKCGAEYKSTKDIVSLINSLSQSSIDKIEYLTATYPLVIDNQNRVFNLYNGFSVKVKGGAAVAVQVQNVPFGTLTRVSGWCCLVYNITTGTLSVKQYYNTEIIDTDVIIAVFRALLDHESVSPDTFTITSVYYTMLPYQLKNSAGNLVDMSLNYGQVQSMLTVKVEYITAANPLIIDNVNRKFNINGGLSIKVNGGAAISISISDLAFGEISRGTGWACLVYNTASQTCSVKQYFYTDVINTDIILAIFRIAFDTLSGTPNTFKVTSVYYTMLAYQLNDTQGTLQKSVGYDDIALLQQEIDGIVGAEKNITIPDFEMGYISADGHQGYNASAIRSSDFVPVGMKSIYCKGDVVAFKVIVPTSIGIVFNVHCYDVNKTSLGRTPQGVQNVDNGATFNLLPGTKFVKFTSSDSELADLSNVLSSINANKANIFSVKEFSEELFATKEELADVEAEIGIRTMLNYAGQKISLRQKADFEHIFSLRDAGVYNQGAAIYGNYLFAFHTGNAEVDVYDLTTNNLVQTIAVSDNPQGENHANNADFGVAFADASDLFPLLYVTTNLNDEIWVYRVSGTIGNLVMTKYQVISLNTSEIGIYPISSFAVDKENNKIVFTGYKNANYDVSVNNPGVVGYFEIPDTSSDIQVASADVHFKEVPWVYAFQGCFAVAGKIYSAFGNTHVSAGICVYDYANGIVLNKIAISVADFGDYFEPEGLCEYNDEMIMTSQHLKVYKFAF